MITRVLPLGLWLLFLAAVSGCGNFMKLSKSYAAQKAQAPKTVRYEVPELYELLLVAASQTEVFQKDSNLVNQTTPYFLVCVRLTAYFREDRRVIPLLETKRNGKVPEIF